MNERIIIIDNHPLIRLTVRHLMESEGFEVVGEAAYEASATDVIYTLQPEIVILELELPGTAGCTALNRLTEQYPAVKFIVLTAEISGHVAIGCLRAGACGFVSKCEDPGELVSCVRVIANGGNRFSADIIRANENKARDKKYVDKLSATELRILQEVAQGLSSRQIADRLSLTVKMVNATKASLLIKLNSNI